MMLYFMFCTFAKKHSVENFSLHSSLHFVNDWLNVNYPPKCRDVGKVFENKILNQLL